MLCYVHIIINIVYKIKFNIHIIHIIHINKWFVQLSSIRTVTIPESRIPIGSAAVDVNLV